MGDIVTEFAGIAPWAASCLLVLKARLIAFSFLAFVFLVLSHLFLVILLFRFGLTFTVRAFELVCLLIVRYVFLFLSRVGFIFLLLQVLNENVFELAFWSVLVSFVWFVSSDFSPITSQIFKIASLPPVAKYWPQGENLAIQIESEENQRNTPRTVLVES